MIVFQRKKQVVNKVKCKQIDSSSNEIVPAQC